MPDRSGSNIVFLDESHNHETTRSCILSVQLSTFRISCLVYDTSANKYIGFLSTNLSEKKSGKSQLIEIEKIIEQAEWLRYPYKKTYFLIENHLSTIIPQVLFDKSESRSYLEFNQMVGNQHIVQNDIVKNNNAVNVFAWNEQLSEKILLFFPEATTLHFSTAFIEAIAINFKNQIDKHSVFLNVREDYFDLGYFKENKLVFYNLFRYKTKEDFIYFLLAALEQLSLNPEEARIHLMGYIELGDRLHEMANKYVRNSNFISSNRSYQYAPELDEANLHQHYVLFNLFQCVS